MFAAPSECRCDVLVVGAGPAGSACAQLLAAAGQRVLLVDQHEFPRDKVCGDGLIPDSHAALQRLGVADEVKSLAAPVAHVRCVGPRGGQVDDDVAHARLVQVHQFALQFGRTGGVQFVHVALDQRVLAFVLDREIHGGAFGKRCGQR